MLDSIDIQNKIGEGKMFGMLNLTESNNNCFEPVEVDQHCDISVLKNRERNDSWYRYGYRDKFPNLILELYRNSSYQKSIIDYKANLIAGAGFEMYIPERIQQFDGFRYRVQANNLSNTEIENELAKVEEFMLNADVEKYRKDAAWQISLFGGYVGLRYVAASPELNEDFFISKMQVRGMVDARLSIDRDINSVSQNNEKYIFLSDCFARARYYNSYNLRRVSTNLDSNERVLKLRSLKKDSYARGQRGVFAKYVANVTDYRRFYPTSDWESKKMLNYLHADYLLSEHDLRGLETGFALDTIIVRYRQKDPNPEAEAEKKKRDVEQVRNEYIGSKGKRASMMWVEPDRGADGETVNRLPIEIIEIPHNNNPERFNVMREERRETFLNAHGLVSSASVGIPEMSGTGFNSEADFLNVGIKQLIFSRINPKRKIIEDDINQELAMLGLKAKVRIKDNTPTLSEPSDDILQENFTKDEIRKLYGYDALTDEQKNEIDGLQ